MYLTDSGSLLSRGAFQNYHYLVDLTHKRPHTMTRDQLHALVDAQYDQFQALQKQPTFLAFEQQFAQVWTDLGKDILQATVGSAPENTRKKTPVKLDLAP